MNLVLLVIMNKLEDSRIDGRKSYLLHEIILVAFATTLGGGNSYSDMKLFNEISIQKYLNEVVNFETTII